VSQCAQPTTAVATAAANNNEVDRDMVSESFPGGEAAELAAGRGHWIYPAQRAVAGENPLDPHRLSEPIIGSGTLVG
jgi:hypothetical protein